YVVSCQRGHSFGIRIRPPPSKKAPRPRSTTTAAPTSGTSRSGVELEEASGREPGDSRLSADTGLDDASRMPVTFVAPGAPSVFGLLVIGAGGVCGVLFTTGGGVGCAGVPGPVGPPPPVVPVAGGLPMVMRTSSDEPAESSLPVTLTNTLYRPVLS